MTKASGGATLRRVMLEALGEEVFAKSEGKLTSVNWGKVEAVAELLLNTPLIIYCKGLQDAREFVLTHFMRCPTCDGKRHVAGTQCPTCDGKGGIAYLPDELRGE